MARPLALSSRNTVRTTAEARPWPRYSGRTADTCDPGAWDLPAAEPLVVVDRSGRGDRTVPVESAEPTVKLLDVDSVPAHIKREVEQ